jgi:hypothetical protein
VAELSLNRCDISGFVNEVPTHGMAGVMGRVSLDAGQDADVDSPIPVPSPSLCLVLFFKTEIVSGSPSLIVIRVLEDQGGNTINENVGLFPGHVCGSPRH